MVVPPSSRVLRSHARLAKSAGLAEAQRRHLLLIHSVEMHLISIKVLIEMYFILIVPRLKLSSPSQQIPSQRES